MNRVIEIIDKYYGRIAFKIRWLTWSQRERYAFLWNRTSKSMETTISQYTLQSLRAYEIGRRKNIRNGEYLYRKCPVLLSSELNIRNTMGDNDYGVEDNYDRAIILADEGES